MSLKFFNNFNLEQGRIAVLSRGIGKYTAPVKKLGGVFVIALSSTFVFSNTSMAATLPNVTINNSVQVNYGFRGDTLQASDSVSFITAREPDGAGTPAVITLMQNGIDFSGQLLPAQVVLN
jgi:hypothetical protein